MANNSSTRVVIDTNALLSAIVFGGNPRKIIDLIAEDTITVVVAREHLTELQRVILAKFTDFQSDLVKVEKLLERDAMWVKLGGLAEAISRDTDDDMYIEAAILGKCHYLISGDKDLLVLASYKGIAIINPADFLKVLTQ